MSIFLSRHFRSIEILPEQERIAAKPVKNQTTHFFTMKREGKVL